MNNLINIKRFFLAIFAILTVICLIFVSLLWHGFNQIENTEAQLIEQQDSVIVIKDVRCHTLQIQQFLTDVGATHRSQGFQEAEIHLKIAKDELSTLQQQYPELQPQLRLLEGKIDFIYDQGLVMAKDYLEKGIDAGNQSMIRFNSSSNKIDDDFKLITSQLEQIWQASLQSNQNRLHLNRLISMSAAIVVLGFIGVLLAKISQILKREMDRLSYRTTQLNTVLDSAASAIITIDKTGHILSFNKAAETIFGYQLHEIIGQNVAMLMPDAQAQNHDNYIQHYLEFKEPQIMGKRRELIAKRKSGQLFPITLRINPMNIDNELFFSGVIDDISETKSLQAQLGQAQKLEAIGQLASGVAHEINTPIQYIGDNISAVLDNFNEIIAFQHSLAELGDADYQDKLSVLLARYDLEYILDDSPKALKQAQEGVERVVEIVKAMKVFSHIESNQNAQSINLHEALNSALIISRNSYKYLAEIETDYSENVGNIECYASELNQVFLNLIINASHAIAERHTGKTGFIRICTAKLDANNVEITISDNGAGIPVEIQEKVFNLFFTTKEVGKGTGQGLSLAHTTVVEKHHGKLFFTSEVGVGTTFHIQLPIVMSN